jgi:hypothetical protein
MENYLTVQEGVAYNENTLPEPITYQNIPLEVDQLNGWKDGEDISKEIEERARELAAMALRGYFGWMTASGTSLGMINQRNVAALYVMYPRLIQIDIDGIKTKATLPTLASAMNIDKQRLHNHIESFRVKFGIHKFERSAEARQSMARAMSDSWARRREQCPPRPAPGCTAPA